MAKTKAKKKEMKSLNLSLEGPHSHMSSIFLMSMFCPSPVQSGIAEADIPDLQHCRTQLGVKADSVLAQEFLIDPVYYGHFRMTCKVCNNF